jgi:plastocyanin
MNKNVVTVLVVAVILIAGGIYMMGGNGTEEAQVTTDQTLTENQGEVAGIVTDTSSTTDSGSSEGDVAGAVKTFNVEANNFKYSVSEIKVKKGETVKIVFKNVEGFHDWVVDEFSAKTKQLKAGESETIEFVADKSGSFEYYCSVGSHRQMGMKGKLIVE